MPKPDSLVFEEKKIILSMKPGKCKEQYDFWIYTEPQKKRNKVVYGIILWNAITWPYCIL